MDTCNDESSPGRLEIPKTASQPSQIQRDGKLRAVVERNLPQVKPEKEELTSDEQAGVERNTSQLMPNDEKYGLMKKKAMTGFCQKMFQTRGNTV